MMHFDELLLQKSYKVLAKKSAEELSLMTLKSDEEFDEFSPSHSKVQKFHFDGIFLSKVYDVLAKKIQRSHLSRH